jgi:signal transduction histidine kinase
MHIGMDECLSSNGCTPEGGTVRIDATRTDEAVELSVTDNWIGIAEADQRRLFQAFEEIDSGAGRRQEGTGLGLALTRRLAQLHGGDVVLKASRTRAASSRSGCRSNERSHLRYLPSLLQSLGDP